MKHFPPYLLRLENPIPCLAHKDSKKLTFSDLAGSTISFCAKVVEEEVTVAADQDDDCGDSKYNLCEKPVMEERKFKLRCDRL